MRLEPLPSCETTGLEINTYAAKECAEKGHNVCEGSILELILLTCAT